jgi:YVTN family beta-propeller protein
MIKGATDTSSELGQGWYHPRPGLDNYLRSGYVVNAHTTSVSPVPNGASETLEYAYDDFAIAQFARFIGRMDVYRRFRMRAQNWSTLFNTSTGLISPRDADGAFMNTATTENGQSGFQEGNAAQYSWMIPQAFGSIVGALGGPAASVQRLDVFFRQLNAGPDKPNAWLGNEPSLIAPWAYVYAGAPSRAQYVNRQAMRTLYAATPDGIPGNDDLGTMSAWWLWNALGLYPANPAMPMLFFEAPLFSHVTLELSRGRTIDIDAPQASDSNDYVTSVNINDRPVDRVWALLPDHGTLRVAMTVAAQPNPAFASSALSLPPQYAPPISRFPASTAAQLSLQTPTLNVSPGGTGDLRVGIRNAAANAVAVAWKAIVPKGITLAPDRGNVDVDLAGKTVDALLSVNVLQQSGLYNIPILGTAQNGAVLQRATAVVRVARAGEALPLAYVADFSDAAVTPFDPRTQAFGEPIAVGKNPGGLAMSADGSRLYTANQGSNDVSVIDTRLQKVVATVKAGSVPAGIQSTHDGTTIWITNYGDGTLQPIDAATLQAGKPITVGAHPEELAISPDDSRIYVVNQGTSELAVVDARSRKLIATVSVGRHPLGVVLDAAGKTVYVTNAASNDVTAVDAASLKVVSTIGVGKTPQGLAVSPDGKWLYVADSASMAVTPIDLRTNAASAPIAVGNGPFDVAFSRDGRYAFVAVTGDNVCAVIDVASGKHIMSIPMGNFPIALAR